MDELSFQMFENFDFENNENFQMGWRAIEQLIDPRKKDSEYLRAQAFYFSKNVQSLDYHQYLLWRHRKHLVQVKSQTPANQDTEPEEECRENGLSLAEVAELIQNNKPIPGVVSVHVQPSNAEPTPSTMIRKLKPWETTDRLSTDSETQRETTDSVSADSETQRETTNIVSTDSETHRETTGSVSTDSETQQAHTGANGSPYIL